METFATVNAASVRDMSDDARVDLLDRLCAAVYGPEHLAKEVIEDMGISRSAWQRWHREPGSIPTLAFLYLRERSMKPQDKAAADLEQIAEQLEGISLAFARLARAAGPSPAGAGAAEE